MSGQQVSETVVEEVLEVLRDAGLDEILVHIGWDNDGNGDTTYHIRHLGTEEDNAAITGAFQYVLGTTNVDRV
jgi:pyruvate formate-lyase activating enzyme-like uncharacterized protein